MTKRKRRDTGPSAATLGTVYARAHHRCELCGIAKREFHVHHRKARGMGGTLDPDVNTPANLLLVCVGCHTLLERFMRGDAYGLGWLVRPLAVPANEPVKMFDGWHLLNVDGTRKPTVRPS